MFRSDVMPKAYYCIAVDSLPPRRSFARGFLLVLATVRRDLCRPRKLSVRKCHCASAPHLRDRILQHVYIRISRYAVYVYSCFPSSEAATSVSMAAALAPHAPVPHRSLSAASRFPMQIHGISLDFRPRIPSMPNNDSSKIQKQQVAV
jgi:hypothetical protein